MRVIILAALLAACETTAGRPVGLPIGPGIDPDTEDSTGAAPRLDLGTDPPIPDLPAETGGTTGDASTGEASTGATSTGEGDSSSGSSSSTSGTTSTTGEDSSSGSSSGESSSSSGEPPPAECGDGVCEASERAPCWALPKEGWCFVDCWKAPECASDCPCTPAAAAAKNWCYADPLPTCAPTAPGGYCSKPDGDVWGFYSWTAKCG